jgi:hypothetical protein
VHPFCRTSTQPLDLTMRRRSFAVTSQSMARLDRYV